MCGLRAYRRRGGLVSGHRRAHAPSTSGSDAELTHATNLRWRERERVDGREEEGGGSGFVFVVFAKFDQ